MSLITKGKFTLKIADDLGILNYLRDNAKYVIDREKIDRVDFEKRIVFSLGIYFRTDY